MASVLTGSYSLYSNDLKLSNAEALNFNAAPSLSNTFIKASFFSIVQYCFHFSILIFCKESEMIRDETPEYFLQHLSPGVFQPVQSAFHYLSMLHPVFYLR